MVAPWLTIQTNHSRPRTSRLQQRHVIGKPRGAVLRDDLRHDGARLLLDDAQLPGPRARPPAQLVARMITEFKKRFINKFWEPVPAEQRWGSLHQVVTLASLVEGEAKLDSERALIAGVLKNRLERGMHLECDATVQYALGKHRRRLTYSDLQIDSPYNTYRYAGLPPGPISNPGLDCLRAALKPARTEYLFYVARGDGGHIFSRTYQEHLAAIRQVRGQAER